MSRDRHRKIAAIDATLAADLGVDAYGPRSHLPRYIRISAALREALSTRSPQLVQRPLGNPSVEESPRWPSGLRCLDSVAGGAYGCTVLASEEKAGKSDLAFSSAIAAAAAGWRVVYLNAELPPSSVERRTRRLASVFPETYDALEELYVVHVSPWRELESFRDVVEDCLANDDRRLLVVADSVNTIAELSDGPSYFDAMHGLTRWLALARRMTEGDVSALIVAETNKRGGVKGEKLKYLADLVVRLRKDTRERSWVHVEVTAGREGGEGAAGKYLHRWQEARYVPEDEVLGLSSFRVVQGGRADEEEPF